MDTLGKLVCWWLRVVLWLTWRHQVRDDIGHEEEVLQNLATVTNKQKTDLREIEESLQSKQKALDKLTEEYQRKHGESKDLQNRLLEVTSGVVSHGILITNFAWGGW